MTDLNAFVPSSSALTLTQATFINDSGEITAEGVLPNGDQRAVLLLPCNQDDSDGCKGEDDSVRAIHSHGVAAVAPTPTVAIQPNLTPSEMKYPIRALSANRRFQFLPPK
jgi:hypothetical protein